MIYVYALVDPPASLAGMPTGFGGAPLEAVAVREVAAVHSTVTGTPPDPTPEHLWHHERVVEALMGIGAALPTRFGTVAAGPDWVRGLLDHRAPAIAATLERVRGRVEVGVRVRSVGDAESPPSATPAAESAPGRAYLLARVEQERHREQRRRDAADLAATVLAPLGELATAHRIDTPRNGTLIANAAYLVKPSAVDAFVARVAAIDAEQVMLELLATGPWPAHSFAGELDLGSALDG